MTEVISCAPLARNHRRTPKAVLQRRLDPERKVLRNSKGYGNIRRII